MVTGEVRQVFGQHTLDYVTAIAEGHIDYLTRMPKDLLLKIITKLDLEDVNALAKTNRLFKKVDLHIFVLYCYTPYHVIMGIYIAKPVLSEAKTALTSL